MPVRPFVYFYSDSENFDENLRVYYGIGGPAKVVFFSYLQFVTRMWLCNELEVGESNEIPVINGRNANLKYRCVFIYIYIYIYIYIQGVSGGMCETSGDCSLC